MVIVHIFYEYLFWFLFKFFYSIFLIFGTSNFSLSISACCSASLSKLADDPGVPMQILALGFLQRRNVRIESRPAQRHFHTYN